ncbi:phosphopantetheine-binding protein [Actinacidiphila yeochonensis]|uniref:phosphopantetheine-binding protein n=1 Tax=Actinacidiphila yeochonensis TaxID=89050 RepID=UPI0038995403
MRRVACALVLSPPDATLVSVCGDPAWNSVGHWAALPARPRLTVDEAVRALAAQGADTVAVLGACAVREPRAVPLLGPSGPAANALAAALGGLHVRGTAVDWPAFFSDTGARLTDLPTYPFQRERYWLEPVAAAESVPGPRCSTADSPPSDGAPDAADVPAVSAESAAPAAPAVPLAERLRGLTAGEQRSLVLDLVRAEAASALGHSGAAAVEPEHPFQQAGLDSLTAVRLRNRLAALSGVPLPVTVLFNHPTPAALAAFLTAEALAGAQHGAAGAAGKAGPAGPAADASVADALDRLEAALAAPPAAGRTTRRSPPACARPSPAGRRAARPAARRPSRTAGWPRPPRRRSSTSSTTNSAAPHPDRRRPRRRPSPSAPSRPRPSLPPLPTASVPSRPRPTVPVCEGREHHVR